MTRPPQSVQDQIRSSSLSSKSNSLSELGDEYFHEYGREHLNALLAYAENENFVEDTPGLSQNAKVTTDHASPFNLATCVRPNILVLQPYRCARE